MVFALNGLVPGENVRRPAVARCGRSLMD